MSYTVDRCYSVTKPSVKVSRVPILVRNLPRTLTESELEAMFAPYGKVISCNLVMDQQSMQSKGFGFVEMDNQKSTDSAIAGLNSTKFENKKIRVKWSNQEEHQSKTLENAESIAGGTRADSASATEIKNAWDTARPKLTEEPGEYD